MFTETTVLTTLEMAKAYEEAKSSQELDYDVMEALDNQLVWWELKQLFEANPRLSVFWQTDDVGDFGGMKETLASLRVVGCLDAEPFHPAAQEVATAVEDLLRSLSAVRAELFYEMLDLGGCSHHHLQHEWLPALFGEYGAAKLREDGLDRGLPDPTPVQNRHKFRF